MTEMLFDENGENAYYADWVAMCRDDIGDNGDRITCARALAIVRDVTACYVADEESQYSTRDIKIALGVIAGIRAQRGTEYDHLTHTMDVVIYG